MKVEERMEFGGVVVEYSNAMQDQPICIKHDGSAIVLNAEEAHAVSGALRSMLERHKEPTQ